MNATDNATTDRYFDAIQHGDVSTVESLLANHPALLEARSSGGLRPLTAATYSGAAHSDATTKPTRNEKGTIP